MYSSGQQWNIDQGMKASKDVIISTISQKDHLILITYKYSCGQVTTTHKKISFIDFTIDLESAYRYYHTQNMNHYSQLLQQIFVSYYR